ncbi:hypothetical protein PVAND_001308 [Polypedilum vanderplanki]|uniref:Uncharacterized protein n=1 Tax=Polypedilum vanderplanki TaxID=319348 RepID=A0A9J6BNW0_POLVA|nr:hypothetical protein PVAND_001308 [Polypedilum vanderplanki]
MSCRGKFIYPFIVDCLELRHDKKYGRFTITNRDLKAGDILAIEEPFFKFLKVDPEDREYPETNFYNYCVNCLLDNYLDLTPCPECNQTMFCSEKCREDAFNLFHKYECNILNVLPETGNFQMAIRNFFVSLSICNGSITELKELMRKSDERNPTIFDFNLSDKKCMNNSKNYLMSMISLAHQTTVTVKEFGYIFQHHAHLRKLWETEKEFIMKYIERMMQIEILNFHGIKGRSLDAKDPYRRCVGDGSFAFCSLLNHSCCPNVMRIVVDGKMVVIVERPIKAGEQLFDCYIGDSFYFKAKNYRRKELVDYNFLCECLACENEFPDILSGLLDIKDMQTLQMVQKWYRELQDPRKELTIENAKQLALKYSTILNQNYKEDNYPCKEIVLLQLCIVKCFLTAARSYVTFP